MNQKSKMVSFRLPADDYSRLREACLAAGIQNVSELARVAVHRIIEDAGTAHFAIDAQVQELRHKIDILTEELNLLAGKVSKTTNAGA
jgi:predicted DNA-binding protein